MSFIQRDPLTQEGQRVNNEGRALTSTVTVSAERHANQIEKEAYNALFAVNPAGADDCIFYLRNNSDDDLVIEGVWWQTSGAEEVYYKLGVTGTVILTAGAAITPANLNAGSGNIADVTCYSNVADAAVDLTGIAGGITVQKLWLTSAKSELFNCDQDIIVRKNQTFAIYCVDGDTLLRGTVVFNMHESDF